MTTITVDDRGELLSALASASGGDTILLRDGNYGSVTVSEDYSSMVTVRAEDPLGAAMTGLTLSGATNVRFDGIKVDSGTNGGPGGRIVAVVNGSESVEIVNSEVTGKEDGVYTGHRGIYVNKASNVTLRNNDVHDVDVGIVVFGADGITVAGNSVDYYANDAMKFSGITNGTIEENISLGYVFPPSGAHNDFIQFQGRSSDVLVEGNVFLANTIGTSQGIFLNGASYHDITIKDNLIHTGMYNGIYVSKGDGIVVSGNTLLNIPNEIHPATEIRVPGGSVVENNITTAHKGGTSGTNIKLQNTKPGDPYHVEDFYVNGAEGRGLSLADLRPVAGSLAESKGAVARLKELLGGGSSAPQTPEPEFERESDGEVAAALEVALDAGGGAADAFFSGGRSYKTGAAIANTSDEAIYQTERYGNFDYSVPLENGVYDVTFRFAEVYHGKAGKRAFDVRAEGELVFDDLDVYKAAGGKNVAYDETVQVEVSDGRLDLDFSTVVDNAKISGIEIARAEGFDLG
jgi:parallel beta-helix repeat protein